MSDPVPPRRPRHLMDPANPVRQVNDHRLTQVQRWVVSVLAVTTILHLSVGLVLGALFLDEDEPVSRFGVCVIGGLFGVVAAAVGRLIHQKPLPSLWLAVGFVPGLVGIWLVLAGVTL
ncbi:hypothetical protein [Nocardioides halotolerans]|uniref:hypothetical protein n=1 Tax=Nocardioides halotolerans TaxID=433660 RepID=UPI0004914FF8|nr:hypothetical protein [Nocardioides halotolerans]